MRMYDPPVFQNKDGVAITPVTARQMCEIDRVAMDDFGLGIRQLMENAGRSLALLAMNMLIDHQRRVLKPCILNNL